MFALNTKRARDDDFEDVSVLHESKKYRSDCSTKPSDLIPPILSFNPSPPHILASSLTPNDSSDDDETAHPGHRRRSLHSRRPPVLTVDTTMDVDMADSPLIHGDNPSPWLNRSGHQDDVYRDMQPSPIPHQLVNQSLSISGGRTATPIYGHFPRDSIQPGTMDGGPPEGCDGNTFLEAPSKREADWWRRRRLPSPISEDGDAASSPFPASGSSSSTRPHSPPSAALDTCTRQWLTVPEPDLEPTARQPGSAVDRTPSPAAGSVSDAVPRRTKISFSMGYRADCEKCRLRVPGHYNHIVRS
ncbi:hypothetical protein VTN31DRAFT_472 [Thermomyces dupontii]|uniref:uncharacterized protein n=1 Tax=Talaromyces thermophilus TaxID=28565 RepID=UPI0037441A8D